MRKFYKTPSNPKKVFPIHEFLERRFRPFINADGEFFFFLKHELPISIFLGFLFFSFYFGNIFIDRVIFLKSRKNCICVTFLREQLDDDKLLEHNKQKFSKVRRM